MILFNMDHPTIFRQMYDESEKVDYYLKKNIKKVIFEKKGKYAADNIYYDIITMPKSNNKYLLYWKIFNIESFYSGDWILQDKNSVYGSALLLNDQYGNQHFFTYKRYKSFLPNQMKWTDGIHCFTPHFMSRYRERCEVPSSMSCLDAIALFCGRNLNYFYELDYNKMILEKNRKKNGAIYAIKDGVMIVERNWMDIDNREVLLEEVKTFLNDKNLKLDQSGHVPTKDEIYDWAKNVFKKYNGYDFDEL